MSQNVSAAPPLNKSRGHAAFSSVEATAFDMSKAWLRQTQDAIAINGKYFKFEWCTELIYEGNIRGNAVSFLA